MAAKCGELLCGHYVYILTQSDFPLSPVFVTSHFHARGGELKKLRLNSSPCTELAAFRSCVIQEGDMLPEYRDFWDLGQRAAEPLRTKSPPVKPTSAVLTARYQRCAKEPVCHTALERAMESRGGNCRISCSCVKDGERGGEKAWILSCELVG